MKQIFRDPPVLGFAAFSGSGKTTLLTAVLPLLEAENLRVGVIKHSHHDFDIDQPGKDSYLLRKAGARQILLASPYRTAHLREHRPPQEPRLEQLLTVMDRQDIDLILVEGFRSVEFPKLEIHRTETGKPFLHPQDPSIIALVCNSATDAPIPRLDINSPGQVAAFITAYVASTRTGNTA